MKLFAQEPSLKIQLEFQPFLLDTSHFELEKRENRGYFTLRKGEVQESSLIDSALFEDFQAFLNSSLLAYDATPVAQQPFVTGTIHKRFEVPVAFPKPEKRTDNHRLIGYLLTIMYAHLDNEELNVYLENVEQQYDFGLGLKKITDEPLTYKLYGTISIREQAALYQFIASLPTDKAIFIDVSNLSSMGRMYYPVFLEMTMNRPELLWVNPSDMARFHLRRASVPAARMIE